MAVADRLGKDANVGFNAVSHMHSTEVHPPADGYLVENQHCSARIAEFAHTFKKARLRGAPADGLHHDRCQSAPVLADVLVQRGKVVILNVVKN